MDLPSQQWALHHDQVMHWRISLTKDFVGTGSGWLGVSKGGVCLIWTCSSFFVLLRPFWDFPDFSGISRFPGDGPGIFPICPLPLSRPINSTYEEQSRKGPRHISDLFQKKWEPPGLETPRFSFSQLLALWHI